jgi:hypothetical protein
VNAAPQNPKAKKIIVSLPRETAPGVDGEPSIWTAFARTPIPEHLVPPQPSSSPPDVISAVIYPQDSLRVSIPNTIEVFLPGKVSRTFYGHLPFSNLFISQSAWEAVKKKIIEEKLEKLGVEKGSGSSSTVPHIHAPHARAASVCGFLFVRDVPFMLSSDIVACRPCFVVFQAQQTPTGAELSFTLCFCLTSTAPTGIG